MVKSFCKLRICQLVQEATDIITQPAYPIPSSYLHMINAAAGVEFSFTYKKVIIDTSYFENKSKQHSYFQQFKLSINTQ